MRAKRQEIGDRTKLAGAGGRRIEAKKFEHYGRASAGDDRRLGGTKSGGRTAPPVMLKIAAATRDEGPRARNRSLRIASADKPTAFPTSESESPSRRMNSESSILGLPRSAPCAPSELSPNRLAEVLAILAVDLIEALGVTDREVFERLTNRLDDQGRTVGGQSAAAMLGAVGGALMRLER